MGLCEECGPQQQQHRSAVRKNREPCAACSTQNNNSTGDAKREGETTVKQIRIQQSPSDKRAYRGLRLPNGMEVVLISSEAPDVMGAVALSVGVGYFSDPPELPGLAHFCEHMLFLGTKEYPDENEWEHFLATNGGDSNASTDAEITVFQFEVALPQLGQALQRFASFFTCPLFKANGVKREIRAVDSEFKDELQSDNQRSREVMIDTTIPTHPYHKFGWGNLESLETLPKKNGIDVRAELLKFHKRHYSAHAMKLVIHGRNLDQMEQYVRQYYMAIPSTEHKLNDFESFGDPFPRDTYCKSYNIVSIKESTTELVMCWTLPCLFAHYKSSPMSYINAALGHEGIGSLLSFLKAKGWAVALEASACEGDGDLSNTAFWLEDVAITLSELGFQHRMEVAGAVFAYLRMLRAMPVQKWFWQELEVMSSVYFRFEDQDDPVEYVENLARNLHHYPMEHALSGPVVISEYDPTMTSRMLELLTPERVRLDVLSTSFQGQATKRTPWFKTPYFVEQIPKELVDKWGNETINQELKFPSPNPFVPFDFAMKAEERKRKSPKSEPGAHIPVQIHHDRFGAVWHLLDTQFALPKVNVYISLHSPVAYSSAHNHACGVMVSDVLNDWLTHHTYPAFVAGISTTVKHRRGGLELTLGGFNHKIASLAETVFTHLGQLASVLTTDSYIQQRFATNKELAIKEYNTSMFEPIAQAVYGRQLVVCETRIPLEETAEALRTLTVEQVQAYLHTFLSELHAVMLVHGNMSRVEAIEVWGSLRKALNWNTLPKKQLTRALELKAGETTYVSMQARNAKETNSAVEVYYQIGEGTMEARCYLRLLNHLLWEPCFDQLRTKEQLGYQVSSGARTTIANIYGFVIAVQSEEYSPKFLEWRIERFIRKFRNQLARMSKPEYKKSVQGLIAELGRPDNCLAEITNRIWDEICEHTFNFRRIADQMTHIRTITHAEMLQFYDRFIMGKLSKGFNKERTKLVSCVFGSRYQTNAAPDDTAMVTESAQASRLMWASGDPFQEVIDREVIARFHASREEDEDDEDEGDEGDEGEEEDDEDEEEEGDEPEDRFDIHELQDMSAVRVIQSQAELLRYKARLRIYPKVTQQNLEALC